MASGVKPISAQAGSGSGAGGDRVRAAGSGLVAGLVARARRGLSRIGALGDSESAAVSVARARWQAERITAGFPPLLVEAERVATTVAQGIHGRRRVGTGEAFWQYRRFGDGDTKARVDWRRSARSDQLFVRENEWEASQSIWLWRDGSRSMHFASTPALPFKRDRADVIVLATAMLLARAGELVALLGAERFPRSGKHAIERMVAHLLQADAAGQEQGMPPPVPVSRNGVIVWVGDFLDPLPEIEARLQELATRGVSGHLVMVLDPAEETLPYTGRARFEGLEGEAPLLLGRVEGVRAAYQTRIAAQKDGLRDLARHAGWSFAVHHTDHPATLPVMTLYASLAGQRAAARTRTGLDTRADDADIAALADADLTVPG